MTWGVAGGAGENSERQKVAVGTRATRVFTTSAPTLRVFEEAANGGRALESHASIVHKECFSESRCALMLFNS